MNKNFKHNSKVVLCIFTSEESCLRYRNTECRSPLILAEDNSITIKAFTKRREFSTDMEIRGTLKRIIVKLGVNFVSQHDGATRHTDKNSDLTTLTFVNKYEFSFYIHKKHSRPRFCLR